MSDDAGRLPGEEERTRMRAARRHGGICGGCGRELAGDEPVWIERLVTGTWGWRSTPTFARVPVGAECASATFRAATAGIEPAPCVTCGRGVYYQSAHAQRRLVTCSRRCAVEAARSRVKKARGS